MPARAAATSNATISAEIRPVKRTDDAAIARIIRSVLTEYGCTAEGFAIHDPEVDHIYDTYVHHDARSIYFVAEYNGEILGGGGIAPLRGTYQNICELQKFYILPEYRGKGLGQKIIGQCLEFARKEHYQRCYLETTAQMNAAESLYRKMGFEPISMPLGNTGHHGCDRWYARSLV